MKDFLKYLLATVLGLFIAGIVFAIIGLVGIAGFVASSSGTETIVKDQSVFVLDLKGSVQERYSQSPLDQLLGEELTTSGLDDILSSIRKAKEHEYIKGIYLNAEAFACSPASLQTIRKALLDFKESGKFIVAYGGNYSQSTYYLASVADKVAVNPSGSVCWHGLSGQTMFLKGLLDKLGVEMQVFRVGTYKSAVEPFTATEMSPANREQTQAFIGSIWNRMVQEVSESRHIAADTLNLLADRNMDFQPAEASIEAGLADTLMYKDQMLAYLKELSGRDEDESLRTLSLKDMVNVQRNVPKDKSGNTVAVYYAWGEIDGGSSPSYSEEGIHSEKVTRDLRKLREDESVKAVVLRVNSPGGSAYGSEQIWREVSLLKEKKPVVVSMGDYAASGGYYISCAADWIVAEPTTLTGSIGIFGMIPNAEGLLTGKLGLKFDGVKTNHLSDMGQISRPFSEEEKALVQQMVNQGYELFTRRCADGRKMPQNDIKKIAEGRVWTGEMAKELKLVDQLGGLNEALEEAVKRAGIEHYTVVGYPAKSDIFTSLLNEGADRYIHSHLSGYLGEWGQHLQFLRHLDRADRIQARMPFVLDIR